MSRQSLEKYADEFKEAAESAEDEKVADSLRTIYYVARGEPIPSDVARRVLDRAGGSQ